MLGLVGCSSPPLPSLFSEVTGDRVPDVAQSDFAPVEEFNSGRGVAVGNLDGDGRLDLYFAAAGAWLNRADPAGFRFEAAAASADAGAITPVAVALGDFDRDGDLDVALAGQGVRLLANDGAARFTAAGVGGAAADVSLNVAWGDFDGAGGGKLRVPSRRCARPPAEPLVSQPPRRQLRRRQRPARPARLRPLARRSQRRRPARHRARRRRVDRVPRHLAAAPRSRPAQSRARRRRSELRRVERDARARFAARDHGLHPRRRRRRRLVGVRLRHPGRPALSFGRRRRAVHRRDAGERHRPRGPRRRRVVAVGLGVFRPRPRRARGPAGRPGRDPRRLSGRGEERTDAAAQSRRAIRSGALCLRRADAVPRGGARRSRRRRRSRRGARAVLRSLSLLRQRHGAGPLAARRAERRDAATIFESTPRGAGAARRPHRDARRRRRRAAPDRRPGRTA